MPRKPGPFPGRISPGPYPCAICKKKWSAHCACQTRANCIACKTPIQGSTMARLGRNWGGDIMRGEHAHLTRARGNGAGEQRGQGGDIEGTDLEAGSEGAPLGDQTQAKDIDLGTPHKSTSSAPTHNRPPDLWNSFRAYSSFHP